MNKSKLIIVVATLSVLFLMPQALAFTSSFGGSDGNVAAGKSESMSLQSSDSFTSQETLSFGSGVSMESSGKVSAESEGAWENQYWDATSGNLYAATYAYMDKPGSYTYDKTFGASASAVKVSENVMATAAEGTPLNLFYGGFAFNDKSYAAVQTWGYVDSINYQNSLSATASKVAASQGLSADGASLTMESWAERGNKGNEAQNPGQIVQWYGQGSYDDSTTFDLTADQYATMKGTVKSYKSDASIDSKTATASQTADIPVTQCTYFTGHSANGKPYLGEGEDSNWIYADTYAGTNIGEKLIFKGNSKSTKSDTTASIVQFEIKNTPNAWWNAQASSQIGDDGYFASVGGYVFHDYYPPADASAEATTENLANAKMTASAAAKKGSSATVAQTIDASNADYISKGASASSWHFDEEDDGDYYSAYSNGDVSSTVIPVYTLAGALAEVPGKFMASMKGKDTATTKKAYSSVTQEMDAKGASIYRNIGTGEEWNVAADGYYDGEGVYADTELFTGFWAYYDNGEYSSYDWWPQTPVAASRLNGKATVTDTAKGASLSGAWSVNLAKDLTDYSPYYLCDDTASFRRYAEADNGEDFANAYLTKSSTNNARTFSFRESASENNKGVSAA